MAQFPFGTRKTPAMHLTRRAASINASVDIKMCDPPKVFMKLLWKVGALSQIYVLTKIKVNETPCVKYSEN